MNQPQVFGNVLPSNTTQTTKVIENGQNEHRALVRMALQVITGVKEPEVANVASLFKQIEFLDIADVKAIMRMGCDTYSDKYNKYPTPFFWKGVKREVLRKKTAMSPEKIIPKDRPSEEERADVSRQASELAKKFASLSKQGDEKPNLLTKKFARYREYIDKDLVRVDDRDSKLFDQWIPRAQAVQINAGFHDPIIWMSERTLVEKI